MYLYLNSNAFLRVSDTKTGRNAPFFRTWATDFRTVAGRRSGLIARPRGPRRVLKVSRFLRNERSRAARRRPRSGEREARALSGRRRGPVSWRRARPAAVAPKRAHATNNLAGTRRQREQRTNTRTHTHAHTYKVYAVSCKNNK